MSVFIKMGTRSNMSVNQTKESLSDKDKINEGEWVNCYICEDAFRRKRETKRYCNDCHRGACQGEHGNFAYNVFKCVICGRR